MITTRRAKIEDLDTMLDIERNAIKSLYLKEVYKDFFSDSVGEMIVAEEDGIIYGFGKITSQPDGNCWLELLRVDPKYQNKGAGKAIWKRFMEVASKLSPKYIRMYTGVTNVISKHIACLNGVDRAYEYSEGSLSPLDLHKDCCGFKPMSWEELSPFLELVRKEWGNYMCFNRTFYGINEENVKELISQGKLYTDGKSIIALGSRFMPERGINIGFMTGDIGSCIAFALKKAYSENIPKVIVMHRAADKKLFNALTEWGFAYLPSNLLMLEGDFS